MSCSDYGDCPYHNQTYSTDNLCIYGTIEGSLEESKLSDFNLKIKIWLMIPMWPNVDIALFKDKHGSNQGILQYENVGHNGIHDPDLLDLHFIISSTLESDEKNKVKYTLNSVIIKNLTVGIGTNEGTNLDVKNLKLNLGRDISNNIYFYAPIQRFFDGKCYCSGNFFGQGIPGLSGWVGTPGYDYE